MAIVEVRALDSSRLDWEKSPLIPAIAQDEHSKEVLMLAFMDKRALELTMQTGYMHYFSRSKNRIWKKGERSGHVQRVKSAFMDCDRDTLLFLIEQQGAACHTGERSCFFQPLAESSQAPRAESSADLALDSADSATTPASPDLAQVYGTIDSLYHLLLDRKAADPESSYTAKLYAQGVNGFGKKIIEEAGEVLLALKDKDTPQIVYECADLLYHTLVGLAYYNIHPEQVSAELQRRFGLSGLVEKASRPKK